MKGDLVDYFSSSYQCWIAAQVTEVDPETGHVALDVKPQAIRLQEQHLVLRLRLRPGQAQLEWMHAVMQGGRIHDEAQKLFSKHVPAADPQAVPGVCLQQGAIAAIAADMDGLLGICGSVKGLLIEARRSLGGVLSMDGFTSAFWDQISQTYHTYGSALPRQDLGFYRREDPENAYVFESVKTLGNGTYGKVKLVREKRTQVQRAVKIISKAVMGACLDILAAEIENLCRIDHPHVAKLYEFFEAGEHIYLIMDFCSGGELQQRIYQARRERQYFPEAFAVDVMRQVLLAIAHIHAHGIVHLDIKSANIMLMPSQRTLPPIRGSSGSASSAALQAEEIKQLPLSGESWHVVVIDLGVSQFFRPGNFRHNRPMGTPATMAPEVWRGEITPKADIFSLGVVLFEVLGLRLPHLRVPCVRADAIKFWSAKPAADWSILRQASREAVELCRCMMGFDRHFRPTAPHCLTDCYLDRGEGAAAVPANIVERVARLPERSALYLSIALAIARRWPANQWPTVKRWFIDLSQSGSGRVEKSHILEALQQLGVEMVQATKVADAMDLSRDGSVGWTEFVAACIDLGGEEFEGTLREAFDEADSDDDGLLTQSDLSKMLPSGYAAELVRDIFSHLTGRTEPGARLDWPTFHRHFCTRVLAGSEGPKAGSSSSSSMLAVTTPALMFPDVLGLAKDAASKVCSRLFPVPGSPEQEEEDLRRLADMGFEDRSQCLDVLRRHGNALSGSAVEELVCLAER